MQVSVHAREAGPWGGVQAHEARLDDGNSALCVSAAGVCVQRRATNSQEGRSSEGTLRRVPRPWGALRGSGRRVLPAARVTSRLLRPPGSDPGDRARGRGGLFRKVPAPCTALERWPDNLRTLL